jgi:golgi phosphoprotein 3
VHRSLHLHEQLLLLAVHDEKGSFHGGMFRYALAGALVSELVLAGRLTLVEGRRRSRKLLEVVSSEPTGVPVLDSALERIASAKRRQAAARWIARLAGDRAMPHAVAEGLVEQGLLRREEGRVLGLFRRVRYPTSNPDPEDALVAALERALATDDPVPLDVAVVLSLASSAGILRHVFDRKALRPYRARIREVSDLEGIPAATREAIRATQAAVVAATTAAAAAGAG